MISRVYDYYFYGAINFRKEYKKYYKKEFCLWKSYGRILKLLLILQKCSRKEDSMKECSHRSIERNIETLNYDENFKIAFSKAVGGLEDEDKNGVYYE